MDTKKKTELCNITLKNVPCELKVYFTQRANDNNRSLSREIIHMMQQIQSEPSFWNPDSWKGIKYDENNPSISGTITTTFPQNSQSKRHERK